MRGGVRLVKAMNLSELPKRVTRPFNFRRRIGAVLSLLFSSRPTAIAGFVIAVIVIAFYAIPAAGSLSHILKEIAKDSPSMTDGDSTPTVPVKVNGLVVGAALNHCEPRAVSFSYDTATRTVAMLSDAIDVQAATAPMVTRAKIATTGYPCFSTITSVAPAWLISAASCAFNDDQSFKTLSCQVNYGRHGVEVIIHG